MKEIPLFPTETNSEYCPNCGNLKSSGSCPACKKYLKRELYDVNVARQRKAPQRSAANPQAPLNEDESSLHLEGFEPWENLKRDLRNRDQKKSA